MSGINLTMTNVESDVEQPMENYRRKSPAKRSAAKRHFNEDRERTPEIVPRKMRND